MKKMFFLVWAFVMLALSVKAADVGMISTKNETCQFFYPTYKNTQGWFIETVPHTMCENGFVQNHGQVTVYDAFSQPIEQFSGFFNGGYWTGDKPLNAPIIHRELQEDASYRVYFQLAGGQQFDLKYVSQMVSMPQSGQIYGPFEFCNPFRILVVTTDYGLFQDEKLMNQILNEVTVHCTKLCPNDTKILLYGSSQQQPKMDDVFFYAEIDLEHASVQVRKNAASEVEQRMLAQQDLPHDAVERQQTISEPILSKDSSEISLPANLHQDTEKTAQFSQLNAVPHLLTASRVLNKSVTGAAVVHIQRVSGNTAFSEQPSAIQLIGNNLATGWAVIYGDFKYISDQERLNGMVHVHQAKPCQQPYCKDFHERGGT